MDFKKRSINLMKIAKEFGYDVKLTHAQEILARMEGHESRHSKIIEESKISTQELQKEFYYEIHVFHSVKDGFSVAIKSDKELDEDEVTTKALKLNLIDEEDVNHIDYIQDIEEDSYKVFTSHYNQDDNGIRFPDKKVKGFISTDDGQYDYQEFDCTIDIQLAVKDDSSLYNLLEDGLYGADEHTDTILYDSDNSLITEVRAYLEIVNRKETKTGFSVYVDEASFKEWNKEYKQNLKK